MGLFSTSSPFDQRVERATSEKNTEDDWGQIMSICDKIKESSSGPTDALKSIGKRLKDENPRIVLQTITLLDACINNCGRKFLLKVAERDFEQELTKILTNTRTHHKVSEKLRECLKKWAESEFKGDPELSLIPALYGKLQQQGYNFNVQENAPKKTVKYSTDPNVVNTQQEEDDIARAIQLSLQDSGSSSLKTSGVKTEPASTSLYSSASAAMMASASKPAEPEKEPLKVRALYDFEAAEDNELTFKSGEIILVIDNSDSNWWKGSNHRGEGLFPANFVTEDLMEEVEGTRSRGGKRVSFSESVEVTEVTEDSAVPSGITPNITGEIDEEKIDQLLHLLHEADPTGGRDDDPSLPLLEEHVNAMAPTIDAELEQIDKKHAQLARISTDLVDALNLYHQLMREMPPTLPYYQSYNKGMPGVPPGVHIPGMPPGAMMPQYLPPGASPGMPPVFPPGQYPGYMPPTSTLPGGYMPPQSMPATMPPQSQQQQMNPPQQSGPSQAPIQDFQQIPPTSLGNFSHFPSGVPNYGPPMEVNDVTSPPNVNPQNPTQIPPQTQVPLHLQPTQSHPSTLVYQTPPLQGQPSTIPPQDALGAIPQGGMPVSYVSQPPQQTSIPQQPLL